MVAYQPTLEAFPALTRCFLFSTFGLLRHGSLGTVALEVARIAPGSRQS